ncbi:MAG: electron transfer flavoprotein subunit alpha, partial [Actinomycetia bacterium]|nr:electron transfer flavoprotein subunit alpha [Actinomycetes bacterium]
TRMSAGEDDHAAVAIACELARASGGEAVGVTCGNSDPSWALARGVARAVSVTDAPPVDDEVATATVLAAAARTVPDADVLVIGDAEEHPGVAAALAALLGWPVVLGVSTAVAGPDGIEAVRRAGEVEEVFTVTAPVVLAVRADGAETRPPGMKEMLTARKRPVDKRTLAELGVALPAAPAELGTRLPDRKGAQMFEGDPQQAAQALVAALRADGVA